jgi:hypothetical protein
MRKKFDELRAVLCDPEGKCCISGSNEDRAIIDLGLSAFESLIDAAEFVRTNRPGAENHMRLTLALDAIGVSA